VKVILTTNRLFLRELTSDDAVLAFELNKDKDVLKYTGDSPFESIEEARIFLNNYTDYKLNGFGRWGVFIASSNTFIGWCGLKLHKEGHVDIGYRLAKKYWNNGYATEAAQACLEYGFKELGLQEIIGRVAQENTASIKVLEKLKMKFVKKENCEGIPKALIYKLNRMDTTIGNSDFLPENYLK
jgi:ribosomal-protein-alanine N-acetyltransferase